MTEGECALMAGLPNAPSALSADLRARVGPARSWSSPRWSGTAWREARRRDGGPRADGG